MIWNDVIFNPNQTGFFQAEIFAKRTLPQPCWMLISAHWAEISIQQGAGKYCSIAIRMYDCE